MAENHGRPDRQPIPRPAPAGLSRAGPEEEVAVRMALAPPRWFVGLLLAALLVARPQAQTPSAPPPPQRAAQPVFKAATDVIVIDVAVTNDTGDAVSGLTPADFKLEVDGKP